MKKIININLSGRVIPIEDSAYEKLQSYIESLRRHFANEEGRDEIINDIESRIAELMNDKVRKGAASITDADIDEIAASMGRPEDLDAEVNEAGDAPKAQAQEQYTYTRKTHKRLYRDGTDKFVGGVCSGIANYLNTDPAIVRILFAIITFGGFGLGFLIYILLWMFLPASDLESYSGKRLYRNPDDKVIGGVAGGLAAYFNSRASTLRLIFVAPILLSILISIINSFSWNHNFHFFPNVVFGSLSGTFILAYVILWMVLPEARSTYEKMEMRGERVDVNRIRQNVQEGMGNVKERVKQWSEEVKQSAENFGNRAKEFANTQGKPFVREVNETARSSGRGLGHAIGVLFKVFFLFIAGSIAFGLFVAVIVLIFGGIAWWPINDFLWTSKWQQACAWGTLIFFLLVPLVGFIVWIIRRILRARSRNNYLGWTFGFLWTLGWVAAICLVASIANDFSDYNVGASETKTTTIANGKMIVTVSEPELKYSGRFGWIQDDQWDRWGWDVSGDTARLSTIRFAYPEKSNDSNYHVTINKYSYGSSRADVQQRASKIQYRVSLQDSILDLGNGYTIDKASKFRFQQVEIVISVPAGKKLRFDPSVIEKLHPTDGFGRHKTDHHRTVIDGRVVTDYYVDYFHFRTNVDYTMGQDGKLKDPSGITVNYNDNYRYDDVDDNGVQQNSDSLDIQRQLQEEKQKRDESEKQRKESEQRIKELEKQQKASKPSGSILNQMKTKDHDAVAKSSLHVFSVAESFL